jgi:hypothetical protein
MKTNLAYTKENLSEDGFTNTGKFGNYEIWSMDRNILLYNPKKEIVVNVFHLHKNLQK